MTLSGVQSDKAAEYALARLCTELAPDLFYHSLSHTTDDIVPGVERLAALEGVAGESLVLLRTAAFFHDIGFVEGPDNHEQTSARIATEVLPDFGYDDAQVAIVCRIIAATRLPQAPQTVLEQILADADLDVLGREDFWERNQALRAELAAYGHTMDDRTWYARQLAFLKNHRYFTASARRLRDARKQENIRLLKNKLG